MPFVSWQKEMNNNRLQNKIFDTFLLYIVLMVASGEYGVKGFATTLDRR